MLVVCELDDTAQRILPRTGESVEIRFAAVYLACAVVVEVHRILDNRDGVFERAETLCQRRAHFTVALAGLESARSGLLVARLGGGFDDSTVAVVIRGPRASGIGRRSEAMTGVVFEEVWRSLGVGVRDQVAALVHLEE